METIKGHLPELMAFYEVAKSGGFTQAAGKLHLSKAQLSKQVARLESVLKAQLFHRTTRKIALTEEGQHLLKFAQEILDVSRSAAESMQGLTTQETGLIRITAPSSLGDWFAPELLALFREKMPGLKVGIDLGSQKRDLIEENFDFALRAMDETNPDLIARYIGHIKDVIVAAPAYVKKHKIKGADPQELAGLQCLAHSHARKWNSWKLRRGQKDLVIEVNGDYACSSYATTRNLCMAGLGVARLPFYLVKRDLEEGKLLHLYPDYTINTHPLYLVYPGRNYRMQRQRVVKDLIWKWMREQKDVFE